jgi:hypothetical protein
MGLTKDDSSRYQKLAAMPASQFEEAVARAKVSIGQVTTAQLLREARKASAPKKTAAEETITAAVAEAACSVPLPAVVRDSVSALAPPPPGDAAYRALRLRYEELEEAHRQLGQLLAETQACLDAKCRENDDLRSKVARSQAPVSSLRRAHDQPHAAPEEPGYREGPQDLPAYDIDAEPEPWMPAFALVHTSCDVDSNAPGPAARARERRCADCRHHLPRGTCGEPEAAGLIEVGNGFGIAWPEYGHSKNCPAFSGKTRKSNHFDVGGPQMQLPSKPPSTLINRSGSSMAGKPRKADHRPAQAHISEWLLAALTSGPKSAGALRESSAAAGHSWRALQRAAEHLQLARTKIGMADGWLWSLSTTAAEGAISNGIFSDRSAAPVADAVTCLAAYGYEVPNDGLMHGVPTRD